MPRSSCPPCINTSSISVLSDVTVHTHKHTHIHPTVSIPCGLFLEVCKGVINESCVLTTTNSLRGIFKGLQRGWRERETPLLPSMWSLQVGAPWFLFFFYGESGLKTVHLTIQPVLLAQWEVLPATSHWLVVHAIQNYPNPPSSTQTVALCLLVESARRGKYWCFKKDVNGNSTNFKFWLIWLCLSIPGNDPRPREFVS